LFLFYFNKRHLVLPPSTRASTVALICLCEISHANMKYLNVQDIWQARVAQKILNVCVPLKTIWYRPCRIVQGRIFPTHPSFSAHKPFERRWTCAQRTPRITFYCMRFKRFVNIWFIWSPTFLRNKRILNSLNLQNYLHFIQNYDDTV
jgi:hypothetical protein